MSSNDIPFRGAATTTGYGNYSREEFERAVELLPGEDKCYLLQAMQKVPQLVELESNPLKFIQREDLDIGKAAARLALYWKFRFEYFGPDRACLPMTITGHGALENTDIAALRTGMFIPLQSQLHPVLFYNRAIDNAQSVICRKRVTFYFAHLMSAHEWASTKGMTFICWFNSMSMDPCHRKNAKLLLGASPVRIRLGHIFCQLPETEHSWANFFARFTVLFLKMVGLSQFWRTRLYSSASPEHQLETILSLKLGLTRETIPDQCGGEYTAQDFELWVRERQELERHRYLDFVLANSGTPLSLLWPQLNYRPTQQELFHGLVLQQQSRRDQPSAVTAALAGRSSNTTGFGISGASTFGSGTNGYVLHQDPVIPMLPVTESSAVRLPAIHNIGVGYRDSNMHLMIPTENRIAPQILHDNQANTFIETLTKLVARARPAGRAKHDHGGLDPYGEVRTESTQARVIETDTICAIARMGLQEALEHIPEESKSAYLEAMRLAPNVVEQESPLMHYLNRDDYNLHSAALRLVNYWRLRKDVFGERAFLPMVQSGRGALTRDDVVVLRSGAIAVLPKDNAGRTVVLEDRSRMVANSDVAKQSMLRSIFYVLTVLSENDDSRNEGIVWLNVAVTPRVVEIWEDAAVKSVEIMECFPVRIKAAHLLVCPPKAGKKQIIDNIVAFMLRLYVERFAGRAIMTTGEDAIDLKSKMEKYGIGEAGLPLALGGSLAYESWTKFLRQQLYKEQARVGSISFTPEKATAVGAVGEVASAEPFSEVEKKERKRKLNVIHSRQKRERKRALTGHLEDECRDILEQNRALEADNARLENLLRKAKRALLEHNKT